MSDHYGEDPVQGRLREIAGNIIDVETALGKTNELLGKILEMQTTHEGIEGSRNSPKVDENGESTHRSVYLSKPSGIITGDGEFLLRLVQSVLNIYKPPTDYEDAWRKLTEMGLIYYERQSGGGFRPSVKGREELERIYKAFPRGKIGWE